jgi:type IV fimbrial biogenesis protein FimT
MSKAATGFNLTEAGFTLTEMVIVMAIVAILMAIGVPSFKYVTTSNRLSTEVNGLLGDLQYARSEAIKEGLPVTVCSSNSGTDCDGLNNGNDWQGGWIVFLNPNSALHPQYPGSVIRVQTAFSSADTFEPLNTNLSAITFNREGYATTQNAATVTLLLHDSTANAAWTRCLAISSVGMLATQRAGVGNCS